MTKHLCLCFCTCIQYVSILNLKHTYMIYGYSVWYLQLHLLDTFIWTYWYRLKIHALLKIFNFDVISCFFTCLQRKSYEAVIYSLVKMWQIKAKHFFVSLSLLQAHLLILFILFFFSYDQWKLIGTLNSSCIWNASPIGRFRTCVHEQL